MSAPNFGVMNMSTIEKIDLRSDTVTQPCKMMRNYISKSEVGDNFYGEDKITNELEEYCADFFGKEAALFSVSGTMSNQIAIRTYIQPGNEIILDASYHINYYEYSATSSLGGVLNLLNTPTGIIYEKDLLFALNNRHRSFLTGSPKLLCLENTINYHTGKIYPLEDFQKISSLAKKYGLNVHLDGARLLNACSALQINVHEYTSCVDSVMVSFSKGLGAPVGSILAGSKDFILETKKYQKWYGGGLHQTGIIAAGALYAIKHNIPFLIEDNTKAKFLGSLLMEDKRIKLDYNAIETNIVMFSFHNSKINIKKFVELMKKQNILLYLWDHNTIRMVTHKNVSSNQIKVAAYKISKLLDDLNKEKGSVQLSVSEVTH